MRARLSLVVSWILLLAPGTSGAELDADRFAFQAPVYGDDHALLRLALDAEVLDRARMGLADLRLTTVEGEEIPYVLLGKDASEEMSERRTVAVEPLEVRRERTEEARTGVRRTRQTLEVPAPRDGPGWTLIIEPGRREVVRALTLEGIRDGRVEWRRETSLFRLASGAERVRYPIPKIPSDQVRLVVEGEEDGFLDLVLRYETASSPAGPEPVRVSLRPLEETALEDADGWARVVVERPPGVTPHRLSVATSTTFFDRSVRVLDRGPGQEPREIGSGRIFRVPSFTEVERLEVALEPARGDRLEVWIESGDSPRLADLEIAGLVEQPALVFARPEVTDRDRVATLLVGGGAASRPRYDVASLRLPPGAEESEGLYQAARGVVDPARAGRAWTGTIEPNPSFDAGPALAFALRPGAAVRRESFRFRQALLVPEDAEPPLRIVVEAAVLARLSPGRGDLRIVDSEGRQWPYLWTRARETEWLPLTVETTVGEGRSRYGMRPPEAPVPAVRLRLRSDGPVYMDRPYELVVRGEAGEPLETSRGRLRSPPRGSSLLEIPVPGGPVTELLLTVEDGDERPVRWRDAELGVPTPVLFLAATPGEYSVLFGAEGLTPPRYDLEREGELVLGLPADTIPTGEVERNPAHGTWNRIVSWPVARIGLWLALVIAVSCLGVLTLRLVREE